MSTRVLYFHVLSLLSIAICAGTAFGVPAHPLDVWHWREPLPQGNTLEEAAFGNGLFVAVGQHGTILTSTEGINWTRRDSGTTERFTGVNFVNGRFIALGEHGAINTSSDGVTWTPRNSDTVVELRDVAYGNGQFVAVGVNSFVVRSSDGINWLPRTLNLGISLNGVAFGAGLFVAVGANGILTSSNGVSWNVENSTLNQSLVDVIYERGMFVVVGEQGKVATSADGTLWSEADQPYFRRMSALVFGRGTFVGVGDMGESITSSDGFSWRTGRSTDTDVRGLAFGNNTFVGVGARGAILNSPDGQHWSPVSAPYIALYSFSPYAAVAASENLVVAVRVFVSSFGSNIVTSVDGVNWIGRSAPVGMPVTDVAYGDGRFVIVGNNQSLVSSNGADWNEGLMSGLSARSVAYGAGRFAVVGDGTSVATSSDGQTWTSRTLGAAYSLSGVAYGNGRFVAVGPLVTAWSAEGSNWNIENLNPGTSFYQGVAFGNGLFVAATDFGIVATSSDGITWTEQPSDSGPITSISYGAGGFLAVGWNGLIESSTDGTNWQIRPSGANVGLSDVSFFNGTFVTVGDAILQSDPLANTPPLIAVAPSDETAPETYPASFNVIATGTSPFSYQWLKGGVNVPDGTNSYLSFLHAQFTDAGEYAVIVRNGFGAVTSSVAMLRVKPLMAPVIVRPPANQTVDEFSLAYFDVVADGTPPLYYQWLKDGSPLQEANDAIFQLYAYDASYEGLYSVIVTNFVGGITSAPAALIVRPYPPSIFQAPANQLARPGGSASFQVDASSNFPLTYQWLKDGATIDGATNSVLNLLNVQLPDAGLYWVVVSARSSSSTSTVARLTVESSTALDHWEVRPVPLIGGLNAITYGNDLFVAVGEGGTILHSSNGGDWNLQTVGSSLALKGVGHGRGGFVTVGVEEGLTQSVIYASANGVNWSPVTAIANTSLRAVTYGNGIWVAVGLLEPDATAVVFTSSDATSWTRQLLPSSAGLHAVTYGQGLFVATGASGLTFTSADGFRWINLYAGDTTLDGVSFGAGSFVAVGEFGRVIGMPGASYWRDFSAGSSASLRGITFGNGNFVAVGGGGAILNSYDGGAWLNRSSALAAELRGVAYGNDIFVVVGDDGLIARSEPLPRTPPSIIDQPRSQDLLAGSFALFEVTAGGGAPLRYQWFKDSVAIQGATSATLELFDVQPSQQGSYRVRVMNDLGVAFSQTAGLRVEPRVPPLGWHVRNPALAPNRFNAVIHGNGLHVAVGDNGTIITSPDGTNWAAHSLGTNTQLQAISYGNGRFVAMGPYYLNVFSSFGNATHICTSLDGTNWTFQVYPHPLNDMRFGNGLFVAVEPEGQIVTSTDGVDWVRQSSDGNSFLYRIAYGNGRFVITSFSEEVLTSTNGTDWTTALTGAPLGSVSFGNGHFVGMASSRPGDIFTSTDGMTWRVHSSNMSNSVSGLRFENGLFLALTYNVVWSSADTTNWVEHPFEVFGGVADIAYGGGLFVGVGGPGEIVTSIDLNNWTSQNRGPRTDLRSVTWGNGIHVAVGPGSFYGGLQTTNIFTSIDGITWDTLSVPDASLESVAFGNGIFVAVGSAQDLFGAIRSVAVLSADGLNWSLVDIGIGGALTSVAYAQGRFVAVGDLGTILTSTNGVTWNLRRQENLTYLKDVTYGNGRWVAIGTINSGTFSITPKILVSSNGLDWSDQAVSTSFPSTVLNSIAYGKGLFVAVGQIVCFRFCTLQGEVWTSPDGANWTRRTPENLNNLYGVTYGNDAFVAVGYGGTVVTSSAGEQWTHQDFGTSSHLFGVTAARGRFVAVGGGGLILQSDQLVSFSPPVAQARVISPVAFLSSNNHAVIISGNGSNAAVALDGSLSSDPENDPLQFFWFADGNTAPFATSATASVLLAVGPHEITLRVDDGAQSDTDALVVEVVTASDAVDALEQLVEQSSLSRQDKRKLLARLEDARAGFASGSLNDAIKDLYKFLKKVRQIAREHPALAVAFTDAAQQTIDALRPPGERQSQITKMHRGADGSLRMEFTAPDGPDYAVECSADGIHWRTLGVPAPLSADLYEFEDHDPPVSFRFYRVVER
jgi:Ig-like domain-containing protein